MRELDEISGEVLDIALRLHRDLGPGAARLSKQPVGLLLNLGGATLKEGVKRVVNDYNSSASPFSSPRLRVNQP